MTTVELYERGAAIVENRILAAMEKALGCKLPRAPKKTKAKPSKGVIREEDW